MADREKVMQWLKICANGCKDECPYEYKNHVYRVECKADLMSDALELLKEQPNAVQCKDCKYWGKKSGLTARKCSRQGIITGQFDFCSYGRTVKQNDSN